jgi:hypothetical protein
MLPDIYHYSIFLLTYYYTAVPIVEIFEYVDASIQDFISKRSA